MKTRALEFQDSLLSLLAITIVLFFIFPLYWGFSTSLRNPLDTFTVTGIGIPWQNFSPTLNNWVSQLEIVEMRNAVVNCATASVHAPAANATSAAARQSATVPQLLTAG